MGPISMGEGRARSALGDARLLRLFPQLGIQPAAGRFFQPDEDENPGGHPVAVLSHHLWQTRFAGDSKMSAGNSG